MCEGMNCPNCKCRVDQPKSEQPPNKLPYVIKSGTYLRSSDSKLVQRYLCLSCKKSFSDATFNICKNQKKRYLNKPLFHQFVSGVSQRRLSRLYQINLKTVARKLKFLGVHASEALKENKHLINKDISSFVFDDMESFEHSKLKPLSISLAVEEKTRFILGYAVSRMPAKGLLTQKSIQKYGKRKDERAKNRRELLKRLKPFVRLNAQIKSDESTHYIKDLSQIFPGCEHKRYKGRRGCVVGQGELKSGGFDPLFSLNHTAAMLRANINRLFRRTWNTTKDPECLSHHIALYVWYHNFKLLS